MRRSSSSPLAKAMKRKSSWLSFTACALTAASVPTPARAVQRAESNWKPQVCRVCPMRTGGSGSIGKLIDHEIPSVTDAQTPSGSAKGAPAFQPGATPQVTRLPEIQG